MIRGRGNDNEVVHSESTNHRFPPHPQWDDFLSGVGGRLLFSSTRETPHLHVCRREQNPIEKYYSTTHYTETTYYFRVMRFYFDDILIQFSGTKIIEWFNPDVIHFASLMYQNEGIFKN